MRCYSCFRFCYRVVPLLLSLVVAVILPCNVSAQNYEGLFDVYLDNRKQGIPNYITADLLLVSYSLIRQRSIAQSEAQQLLPLFQSFLADLESVYRTANRQDAVSKANQNFVVLLQALLQGDGAALDHEAVKTEYQHVQQASTAMPSPMWGQVIDYTQFKPRGRYDRTPQMRNFFRAFRYAGAALFAVKPSKATGVSPELAARMSAQALQLVEAIDRDDRVSEIYSRINALLTWQFGTAEDLSIADIRAVATSKMTKNQEELAESLFEFAKSHGRQPRILSGVVDKARLEEGVSARDALTGWRLLPQRYSADSAVFQRLVYDRTGEFQGQGKDCPTPFSLALIGGKSVKGFPRGIELMALLGSRAAQSEVKVTCEDRFQGYDEAQQASRRLLDHAAGANKEQLAVMRSGFPGDEDKTLSERRLETMLAFWTWQRYLNILYQKQSYTVSGKSFSPEKDRAGATLEKASVLYRALYSLVNSHVKMTPDPYWVSFGEFLERVLELSEKLDKGGALNAEDEAFLNGLDRELVALTTVHDKPIVIDVHTNPATGQVLEEATGYPRVVAGRDGARGAVFTHREFKQPMNERLTDEAWREMLRKESH